MLAAHPLHAGFVRNRGGNERFPEARSATAWWARVQDGVAPVPAHMCDMNEVVFPCPLKVHPVRTEWCCCRGWNQEGVRDGHGTNCDSFEDLGKEFDLNGHLL